MDAHSTLVQRNWKRNPLWVTEQAILSPGRPWGLKLSKAEGVLRGSHSMWLPCSPFSWNVNVWGRTPWAWQPLGSALVHLTLPVKACQNHLGAWPLPPWLLEWGQRGFSREFSLLPSWKKLFHSQGSLGHKLDCLSLSPFDRSEDHRMAEAERGLWRSPCPIPLTKQSLTIR